MLDYSRQQLMVLLLRVLFVQDAELLLSQIAATEQILANIEAIYTVKQPVAAIIQICPEQAVAHADFALVSAASRKLHAAFHALAPGVYVVTILRIQVKVMAVPQPLGLITVKAVVHIDAVEKIVSANILAIHVMQRAARLFSKPAPISFIKLRYACMAAAK